MPNLLAMSRRAQTKPSGPILVVDDEPLNVELLRRLMTRRGYEVMTADNGARALERVAERRPELVLLDVQMPELDGFEVCRRIKGDADTRFIPVVLITALSASEDRVRGIEAGADDFVSKPFVIAELEARVNALLRAKRHTDELDSAEKMILTLALTIEARDPYTSGHCERLANFATALGSELGVSEPDMVALYRGGFLHDVGKVGTPDAILLKQGPLTPDEMRTMQEHTVIGDRLCGELHSLTAVRPIVRSHHERLDGTGYPDGLRGDEIPFLAQIMCVVDCYDAMTTQRPYKKAFTMEDAIAQLRADVQKGWKDPRLVETFAGLLHEKGPERLSPALLKMAS